MAQIEALKKQLKRGQVYRREDLAVWSKSIDRHLQQLLKEGTLQKLSQGLYYYPKASSFGQTPAEDHALIRSFLKDDRFLLTSPNAYNSLGLGTTQLYNDRWVYNHKRHGVFVLGGRRFSFRIKPHFPKKTSEAFLFVDLLNNLDTLAEDKELVLKNAAKKAKTMPAEKLKTAVAQYGNQHTKKMLMALLPQN